MTKQCDKVAWHADARPVSGNHCIFCERDALKERVQLMSDFLRKVGDLGDLCREASQVILEP